MGRLIAVIALAYALDAAPAAAATCTATGFYRDAINLTAALINPANVTGPVDATGCHIGVYFGPGASGRVSDADIFGASYFGIAVDAGFGKVRADISDTWVHHIGESPFNGAQHGVGIYFAAFEPGSRATGRIADNTIERYQKGGIVANGEGVDVEIARNTVIGLGPVPFIAQNGIQIGYGAAARVRRNRVWGNAHTGVAAVSGGILVVGGPYYSGFPYTIGTEISSNIVSENDVGIFLSNLTETGSSPGVATSIRVVGNLLSKSGLTNNYAWVGYQAGISDVGNGDKLIDNTVSGDGYDPGAFPAAFVVPTDSDPTFTARPRVQANRN